MLRNLFLLFLLTSNSKCNVFDGIEPVHHEVLLAYFSDPVLQVTIHFGFFLNYDNTCCSSVTSFKHQSRHFWDFSEYCSLVASGK